MIEPYYERDGITIYNADCRDVLPQLETFDSIVTDPPYPSYLTCEYQYHDGNLEPFRHIACPQLIFWTPSAPFPLDWDGMHVWDKATGSNTQFELIYQRVRGTGYKVHRYITPHNRVRAKWCGDVCNTHPSQKPLQLMRRLLLELGDVPSVFDPFMGSGTTLVAAKLAGIRAVGIELEEKYCEIAANRLAQGVLNFA